MEMLTPLQVVKLFLILSSVFLELSAATNCLYGDSEAVAYTIVVDKRGGANVFTSVQAAINSIPSLNNRWIKVQVNPGVYVEKVTVPADKPCVVLEGRSRKVTVIKYNDHVATDSSSTFTAIPDNIVVKGITFMNTFNRPKLNVAKDMAYVEDYTNQMNIKQAVAARVLGDKVAFFYCGFVGLQDTLWDAEGRHYFYKCYIEGAIDFIFGSGQSIYEDCLIKATAGELSGQLSYGYITAQKRSSRSDPSGFVFKGGEIIGNIPVYLGRAWGPFSRVIFEDTIIGSCVIPQGWDSWGFGGQERNFMYVELNCRGPGAKSGGRVDWVKHLSVRQLRRYFSLRSFIDQEGWISKLPCLD